MIDIVVDEDIEGLERPADDAIEQAVRTALDVAGHPANTPELCIRFAGDNEVHALNSQWRNKDKVTDVLSFPMQEPGAIDMNESLGDIILATPFVGKEAERLELPACDHMLHLIIHGVFHLLGYDHMEDDDADQMHTLERKSMQRLNLHNPYPDAD